LAEGELFMNIDLKPKIIEVSRNSSRLGSITLELRKYGKNPFVISAKNAFAKDLSCDSYIFPFAYAPVHYAIEQTVGDINGKNILHIACNWGPYVHYLETVHGAEAYGIDVDPLTIEHAGTYGGTKVAIADAAHLPFREESFDVVLTSHFLDWIYIRYITGIREVSPLICNILFEAKRVLKPGGSFLSHKENILPTTLSQFKPSDWRRIVFADDPNEDLGNIDILSK
jgi:SAM-dependent methyltransferase